VLATTRLCRNNIAGGCFWQWTALVAPLVTSSAWLWLSGAISASAGTGSVPPPASAYANLSDPILQNASRNAFGSWATLEVEGVFAWLIASALIVGLLVTLERTRRLVLGTHQMHRLLRRRALVRDDQVCRLGKSVADSAGLRRTLLFTHCESLASPSVIGCREICLPTRLLTTLSRDEMKAVLAHEVAHISRGDWLWFPVLAVVDAVLTLQPLNHLLVRECRRDAERDCDLKAVQWTGNPQALARALLHAAEHALGSKPQSWSAGMTARAGETLSRVRHLLKHTSVPHRSQPGSRLAPIALALALAPWSTTLARASVGGAAHNRQDASEPPSMTPHQASEVIDDERLELARQRHFYESELQERLWVNGEPADSPAVASLQSEVARLTQLERTLQGTE